MRRDLRLRATRRAPGSTHAADLLALLASWGDCDGCPADINGDGLVNTVDLLTLLANWG